MIKKNKIVMKNSRIDKNIKGLSIPLFKLKQLCIVHKCLPVIMISWSQKFLEKRSANWIPILGIAPQVGIMFPA